MSPLPGRLTSAVDTVLDRSVVLGYSRIGYAVRSRLRPDRTPRPRLEGRRILVTGATSDIGRAACAELGRLGATVHVLGRSEERVQRVVGELRGEVPDGEFVPETCDVGDLDAVRAFCADLAGRVPALHGLAHNAGTMPPERTETAQWHELSLAVHVLGPVLMTCLLRDRLAASGDGRVVFMSSGGMYTQPLRADDIEYREAGYSGAQAYARTKRFQVTIAEQLDQRLRADGIRVDSMHPGWVETKGVAESLPRFRAVTRPVLRTDTQGADTLVWLLATEDLPGRGAFWHDHRQRPTHFLPGRHDSPEARARLWSSVTDAVGCEP